MDVFHKTTILTCVWLLSGRRSCDCWWFSARCSSELWNEKMHRLNSMSNCAKLTSAVECCFWLMQITLYLSRISSKTCSIKTTMTNLFLISCTCEVFHHQTTHTLLLQKSDVRLNGREFTATSNNWEIHAINEIEITSFTFMCLTDAFIWCKYLLDTWTLDLGVASPMFSLQGHHRFWQYIANNWKGLYRK